MFSRDTLPDSPFWSVVAVRQYLASNLSISNDLHCVDSTENEKISLAAVSPCHFPTLTCVIKQISQKINEVGEDFNALVYSAKLRAMYYCEGTWIDWLVEMVTFYLLNSLRLYSCFSPSLTFIHLLKIGGNSLNSCNGLQETTAWHSFIILLMHLNHKWTRISRS